MRQFIETMSRRLVTSIFMATDRTIRALGERVQSVDPLEKRQKPSDEDTPDDLFQIEFELYNGQLRYTPGAEEMQDAFREVLMLILDVPKFIPLWNAKGDYYDHVLQQISPIVQQRSEDAKLEDLTTQLSLTKTAKSEVVA